MSRLKYEKHLQSNRISADRQPGQGGRQAGREGGRQADSQDMQDRQVGRQAGPIDRQDSQAGREKEQAGKEAE